MANEVTCSVNYTYSASGTTNTQSNTFIVSMSGVNQMSNTVTITNGVSSPLNLQSLNDIRCLCIKNLNTGVNVAVSLNSGMTSVFSLIRPLESIFITPSGTGVWFSGVGTGSTDLSILGNEA
jgi:hypothetical protein